MEIAVTILYIIACVLLFSITIAIHEFGHFIVALKLGLRVEAFSLGFGPVLLKWKSPRSGVEYRLSAIPLGGYVSIPDVDPEGTKAIEGARSKEQGASAAEKKTPIPAWKEIAVAFAGPGMNLVLAVMLALILAAVPSARFGELPAEIGQVLAGGPAEKGGLRSGDQVVSVGGHSVSSWMEMQTEVQIAGGKATEFKVVRSKEQGAGEDGETLDLLITPERNEVSGAWYIMALSVTNATGAVAWMPARNPWKQLAWDCGSIFRVLKGLVTPREAKATSQALGGPVMIAEGIYRSMRHNAWDGIGFLRFLNVNLAVLNLLPIPVLDGGLILFALIALICRRRVPEVVVKYTSLVFMALLMAAMALLICRDSWRSWKIHHAEVEQHVHT